MRTWARARRYLNHAEEAIAGTGFIAVVIITLYNVFNRYVLERSGVWAPELAGIIFAWVVFIGASAAWKRGMHVSIDVVVTRLPPPARGAVRLLANLLVVAFLAYATWLAAEITVSAHRRLTPVLRVPFSYVYASAAIGFGLMLVRASGALIDALRGRPEAGPTQDAQAMPF